MARKHPQAGLMLKVLTRLSLIPGKNQARMKIYLQGASVESLHGGAFCLKRASQ
jgi:hypothetical protein